MRRLCRIKDVDFTSRVEVKPLIRNLDPVRNKPTHTHGLRWFSGWSDSRFVGFA